MKLIEPTQKPVKKDFLQKSLDQLKRWLPFGKADEQFEENVIARFGRGLDSRFVMLRNLQLEPLNPPFPPILIGPAGLAVLNISQDKGFFKVKDSSWWKMDKTTHRFNPGKSQFDQAEPGICQKTGHDPGCAWKVSPGDHTHSDLCRSWSTY